MPSTLEAFLGRPSDDYRNISVFVRCFRMSLRIFLQLPSTPARDISIRPLTLQTPSLHRSSMWRRNVDLLSIVYAFRPRLRYRLTLGGITFPRKPWAFGDGDSHPVYRYSSRHIHYLPLHQPSRESFDAGRYAPLPPHKRATASVRLLFPIIIGAGFLDQ